MRSPSPYHRTHKYIGMGVRSCGGFSWGVSCVCVSRLSKEKLDNFHFGNLMHTPAARGGGDGANWNEWARVEGGIGNFGTLGFAIGLAREERVCKGKGLKRRRVHRTPRFGFVHGEGVGSV